MTAFRILSIIFLSAIITPGQAEQTTAPLPPNPGYYPPSDVSLDFLTGRFSPSKHPNFIRLGSRYGNRSNMYLQKETYEAFKKMHKAAKKDGVRLVIRSASRSFVAQKSIWEGKWTGKRKVGGVTGIDKVIPDPHQRALKILEYSSMPGSSRHHWGTEVDLNAFNNKWFTTGKGKKTYDWLVNNARKFGFCQTYTAKNNQPGSRSSGYNEEKWHWSYVPLAGPYTEQAGLMLQNARIEGFMGAETAMTLQIVEKYVMGINQECRKPVP